MSLTVTKPVEEMREILRCEHATAGVVENRLTGQGRWESHHKLVWCDAGGLLWQCDYSKDLTGRPDKQPWGDATEVQSVRVHQRSRLSTEYVEPRHVQCGDVCLTPAGGPHEWRYEAISGPIGLPAALRVRKVAPAGNEPTREGQMTLDEWAALGGDYFVREVAPPVIVRVALPAGRARAASPALSAVIAEHVKQVELFAEADQDSASAKRLQDAAVLILMCAVGFLNYTPLHVLFAAFSARHDDADFVARVRKILDKHGDDRQALQRIAAALTISAMDASTRASEVT